MGTALLKILHLFTGTICCQTHMQPLKKLMWHRKQVVFVRNIANRDYSFLQI
jgi:hypothetical protein